MRQEGYDTVSIRAATARCKTWPKDPNSVKLIESSSPPASLWRWSAMPLGCCATSKPPRGEPLVDSKKVTGFTNGEEADVGLTKVVPFLVEDELLRPGAIYPKVKKLGCLRG
jgi:hypothetical protein